jgi:MFS family permease
MTAETLTGTTDRSGSLAGNRDFRLLWLGQGVSELGSSMAEVALPLLLLFLGYSTSVVGAIGTVVLLVGLVTEVPSGYLADRFDQRRIMLVSDLARAGAMAALTLCALAGTLPLWVVLAAVVVSHVGLAAFYPAESRALRRIVPRGQVVRAVSINQARAYGADIIGPAIGGALFTAGYALPIAVDTVTFLVAAAGVLAIRTRLRPEPAVTQLRFLPAVREGWRYLWRDRFLRWSTAYSALINLAFAALTYVFILGVGGRVGGALTVGPAITVAAAAALVGSLIAPRAQRRIPLRAMLLIGPVIAAAILFAASRTGSLVLLVVGVVALCFYGPICQAMLTAVQMVLVPEHLYGRVVSTGGFVAQVLQPLAPLTAGLLLGHVGLKAVLLVLAATFAALAVPAVLIPAPELPAQGR